MDNRYAVILAGGQGKRFWPMSTASSPKQLLNLLGDRTLLQMAVDRVRDIIPIENIIVLTNQSLVEASRRAAPELPPENIVGEPIGRDTAPAVALSCLLVERRNPAGVFAILTADQIMKNVPLFQQTLAESFDVATRQDSIITIGIEPSEPSTSFGYIETGERIDGPGEIDFHTVERFVEKPDADIACKYLASGKYLWNAGMFIWSVGTLRRGLSRYAPHLVDMIDRLHGLPDDADFMRGVAVEYEGLERISIDYALMEKADNIIVAKGSFEWDDLGSWTALANHRGSDNEGNVVIGDLQQVDSGGNIVVSRNRLTALIGVQDLVVVQTDKVTLVCPRERAQDVKQMVDKLERQGGYDEVL